MTFGDIIALTYEYAGDASQSMNRGRVERAVNHAYRDLVLFASSIDETIATSLIVPFWSFTSSSTDLVVEVELPGDFHRISSWYFASAGWGTPASPHVGAGETVAFRDWWRYADPNQGQLEDIAGVCYLRHSVVSTAVLSRVKRIAYGLGSAGSGVTVTASNDAIGIHASRTVGDNTGLSYGIRILYVRNPADMADVADEPRFPVEFHEAIAVGGALRIAAQTNDPIFKTLLERFQEFKQTMAVALEKRRGGAMVA